METGSFIIGAAFHLVLEVPIIIDLRVFLGHQFRFKTFVVLPAVNQDDTK